MFEAIIAICLEADGPCRDVLLPGFEERDLAACEAALAAEPSAADAQCQAAGAALPVEELAPGLFVHMGQIEEPSKDNLADVSNLGFIIGSKSVMVIDTGGAPWVGEALWRAIRQRTNLPVSHVILTHPHPDHVFGVSPFLLAGAQIVGHEKLQRALADRHANYLESFQTVIGALPMLGHTQPLITMPLAEPKKIDLGDRLVTITPWPTAHSSADVTLLDEKSNILFAGDLVFHRHAPALDGKLTGWQAVLETFKEQDIRAVIPGHGGPILDWPEGLVPTVRYLQILEEDTRAAIEKGERLGDAVRHIAVSETAHWALFEAYNARNATVAYTELEWE